MVLSKIALSLALASLAFGGCKSRASQSEGDETAAFTADDDKGNGVYYYVYFKNFAPTKENADWKACI